ncbi:hypothetical protein E2C01_050862 [Portunus trituberculatus]|uniref:Uncharacterized protein n=1 Tax=Portunus trituberculatus TaxID=210409 RepID=A0A5B7GI25_PORTR|nr:hypothetical protein [Portunus trituberculatus]
MFGDLNSNLAVPWRLHSEPRCSPVTSDLSLNLSERIVRVPFSHFVCASLCSASMGTNSGDLPPTWPLPAQQVVLVGVRTMLVAARMEVDQVQYLRIVKNGRSEEYDKANGCKKITSCEMEGQSPRVFKRQDERGK